MKKILLAICLVWASCLSFAQTDFYQQWNTQRLKTNKNAMLILGSWAAGNIALGPLLAGNRTGSEKAFHQMNIGWNAVNLGIAAFGIYQAHHSLPSAFSGLESFQASQQMQKILLFNAGLDVGYMMGGLYLKERAKNSDKYQDRLHGFGKSILLQGAFLFAFDLGYFLVLQKQSHKLLPILEGFNMNGNGASWILHF